MSPRSVRLGVLGALVLAFSILLAPVGHAAADTADVVVVHGVPGLTVDVYVNGDLALPGFEPGSITGALPFAPGTYEIAIVGVGGDPATPAIAGTASVAAGDTVTLVAHLAADGTPTLTPFVDDLALADTGEGRLIVRHVAAAPAVDVKLERTFWRWRRTVGVLEELESGGQAQVDVRARRYEASLLPAATSTSVFGPADVRVRRGEATIVYAIGDLTGGTFDLLTEVRDLRSATANVTVVHGVLGLTVDVYVNGVLTLPGFEPRTITDPLPLPCGDYDIAIVPAGGNPSSPAIAGSVSLKAGVDYSLVAHLAADGTPTLSPFVNDLSAAGYRSRLSVRHVAAAPAVDVVLLRRLYFWRFVAGLLPDLENGSEASTVVARGHYQAFLRPAGVAGVTVLGPAPLTLQSRKAYFVYAVGSLTGGDLDLLIDVRDLR